MVINLLSSPHAGSEAKVVSRGSWDCNDADVTVMSFIVQERQ